MCCKPPFALVVIGLGLVALFASLISQVHKRVPDPRAVPTDIHEESNKSSVQRQNIDGRRIVRGRKFPWVASVRSLKNHLCGAVILNKRWLLTVASCLSVDVKSYSVRVGSNKLKGGIPHAVDKIVLHERYDVSHSWANDIAVIKVTPAITFKRGVAPAKLPARGQNTTIGTPGVIIGWGSAKNSNAASNDLRELDVLVYDHEDCKRAYAAIEKEISQKQLCAASIEDGEQATNGDAAAPLTVEGSVVGLLSWQKRGSVAGSPAVYTELSHYIDWIKEHSSEVFEITGA